LAETVTATLTGIPPVSATTQYVEASYGGDGNYSGSNSVPTPLTSALITRIVPSSGLPGTFVKVTGTNFGSNVPGCSYVTFGNTQGVVTYWTPTMIEVEAAQVIGASTTTIPVVVSTCSGVSNAVAFTMPNGPWITGLSPVIGPIGTSVTISGFNFGTNGSVTFNGMPATPTTWGIDTIIVPVPVGATTGPVVVGAYADGTSYSNSFSFTVSAGITGITPIQGNAGTVVTISGAGFGATQGGSSVTFNGVPAAPSTWSDTSITVPVPIGATTGNVAVLVNGASTAGPVFVVLPSISNLSPASGPIGTVVTISGSNFGLTQGISSVAFGQVAGVPTQWSQDAIVVPVPAGAVTGSVVVLVAGQASNALPFTVGSSSPSTASITGTVTQSDGVTPIAGATITVLNGSNPVATAVTGPSGAYAATNLSAATYSVQVSAFGYGAGSQTGISISSGQAAVANFSLSSLPSISYTYNELGRLVGVASSTMGTAGYSYDAVGNILSINRPTAGQESILDFTPKSGPIGTAVTISGTSFSANPQQDAVTFGSVTASVTSATTGQIVVTVPSGATTGPITVTSPSGTATSSASFTVGISTVTPSITSFSPVIANVGATVTISGSGFDLLANDRVEFDGTLANLTSATSTSISTTVPANAGSGPISVATPSGNAISSTNFFVLPSAYTPSQVDFTGQISFGGAFTGTINNGGDIGLVVFNATVGQQISILVNGSSIASATISILGPGGSTLENASIGLGGTILDSISAPATGAYTILVASNGAGYTGSVTLGLSQGSSATTPPASTITGQVLLGTPGQTATVLFNGVANQSAFVQLTGFNFPPDAYVNVSLLSGSTTLASGTMWAVNQALPLVTLPTTGTYTVVIAPQGGVTGSANVAISVFNEQTIPVTPVTAGTTGTALTFNTPGQDAQLTFTGSAQQLASVMLTNFNFPPEAYVNVSILSGSTTLVSNTMWAGNQFLGPITLPTAGPYTLVVAPDGGITGSTSVALSLFNELVGTITSGTPVPLIINNPGQDAQLTFSGTAGQVANVQLTNYTFPSADVVWVSIFDSANDLLVSNPLWTGNQSVNPVTLSGPGPYTLVIAPGVTGNTSVLLTLQ